MATPSILGAVDIGGTKLAVAAVRCDGTIVARRTFPTSPENGPERAARRIVALLRECENEGSVRIGGLGIGCTGPIDPVRGVVGDVDLLPGWNGFPLCARLSDEFEVSAAMENDADAAALAEAEWGGGKRAPRFLYVTIGTGIGAGIVMEGRLYRGVDGSHPELGHQTIDPSGPACYCGAHGCWESLASGRAMVAWGSQFGLPATAREICELARSGFPPAQRVVARESRYLGLGLANLITTFCPDRVALGGGVMENSDLILPDALDLAARVCGLVPFDRIGIARAALGGDTPLLGAARVWQYRFPESSKAQSCF